MEETKSLKWRMFNSGFYSKTTVFTKQKKNASCSIEMHMEEMCRVHILDVNDTKNINVYECKYNECPNHWNKVVQFQNVWPYFFWISASTGANWSTDAFFLLPLKICQMYDGTFKYKQDWLSC